MVETVSSIRPNTSDATAQVLVIACGALAREITAICKVNRLDHVTLTCLPANLHNRPEKIAPAVQRAIEKAGDTFDQILIGYGDCGTGGDLDRVLAQTGAERIGGPHCYAFFTGLEEFEETGSDDFTSFYLTDFLVRQFDSIVIKSLGLDRHPELRDSYFGHYEKVIYLAQTNDPKLDEAAQKAADRLGLAFERRMTGYGDLIPFLKNG